jgi:curved DNA-binding protein CbpA
MPQENRLNYYEILEVSPNASREVLKAAYKSLMQRYHPDKNPGNAEAAAHSVLVVQAYETLSDSSKRAAYDIELKRPLEYLNNIRARNRNVQNSASLDKRKNKSNWLLWLSIILIAWVFWLVLSPSGKRQSAGAETREVGSLSKETEALPGNYQADIQPNKATERAPSLGARTIPVFITDINVPLETSTESTDGSTDGTKHTLTIQTLGVVVGTFDSDKFIIFLKDNKEFINQKLTEMLGMAKYERLVKPGSNQYLKQVILDSIGEITATNRFEEYPSIGTGSPAHYGVVDILLPDSFTIKSLQTVNQKVDEGSEKNLL